MTDYDMRSAFAQLFQGRLDAYGTEYGGAARKGDPEFGGQPERHLRGECAIGVYPIYDEFIYCRCDDYAGCEHEPLNVGSHVRWGCVDFDIKSDHHPSYDYETEDDAHTAATDLQRVLAALDITAWIERTRSCGRHVWVFSRHPVPAATMRRALLVACALAEVSAREVNPKSETLEPDQLGNYVRLPYFGAEVTTSMRDPQTLGTRTMLIGNADWRLYEPFPCSVFVKQAMEKRTDPDAFIVLANHYVPPPEVVVRPVAPYTGALRDITTKLDGQTYVVFRDGPTTGDRSGGLVYVAHGCARVGLTHDECVTLLLDADARWGKFYKRHDCERQIGLIAARAYG